MPLGWCYMRATRFWTQASLADRLTFARLAAAPLLVASAAAGDPRLFAAIVTLGIVTDVLDGVVAKTMRTVTPRGAILDSRADLTFCSALLIGLALLFPEQVCQERVTAAIILVAYGMPILLGWIKFGRLTSYHTILARLSLVLLALALVAWLGFDFVFPLRVGTAVLALSGLEEMAITLLLRSPRDNVSHLFSSALHSDHGGAMITNAGTQLPQDMWPGHDVGLLQQSSGKRRTLLRRVGRKMAIAVAFIGATALVAMPAHA